MQRWALKLRGPHCHLVDLSHRQQSLSHLSAPRNSSVASLLSSISSSDASQPRDVTVNGFVRSVRKQKRVAFAHLGDGSSLDPLQVVLSPEQAEA